MTYDAENLFAKIIRKEIPAAIIFETPSSLAILDAFPCVEGHALLLPKCDAATMEEMDTLPQDTRAQIMSDLVRLTTIVKKACGASAVNVIVNDGPDAGQAIPHVHFHCIPRLKGDQLIHHPKSASTMLTGSKADEVLAKFQQYL